MDRTMKGCRRGVVEMQSVKTSAAYLDFINGLLRWVPSENVQGKGINNHICKFHFVLNQPSVKQLQNAITSGASAPRFPDPTFRRATDRCCLNMAGAVNCTLGMG